MSLTEKLVSSLSVSEQSIIDFVVINGLTGVAAGVSIALPYAFFFYFILGLLEDIGLLSRFVVNAEFILKKLGFLAKRASYFGILLHSGYPKRKALLMNTLSSLSTIPGAILAYYTLGTIQTAIPYAMAFSAASFLYISLADLTPELHHEIGLGSAVQQFLLMLVGVGTIIIFLQFHQ